MQPLRTLPAASAFAGLAAGQVHPFVFCPQDPERQTITRTSFVGRPDRNRAADALGERNSQHFRGIGGGLEFHGVRRKGTTPS